MDDDGTESRIKLRDEKGKARPSVLPWLMTEGAGGHTEANLPWEDGIKWSAKKEMTPDLILHGPACISVSFCSFHDRNINETHYSVINYQESVIENMHFL